MIYFDGVHLVADTLNELHSFAEYIGLKRCWFQTALRHPHYDVTGAANKRFIHIIAKNGNANFTVKIVSGFSGKKLILLKSKSLIRKRK